MHSHQHRTPASGKSRTPHPSTDRATRQRAAIVQAIAGAGRPLSPVELLELAKANLPSINLATVYRAIKRLLELGEIVSVVVPGQPPRYEPASLAHHHHFHCEACDRVFDIAACDTGHCEHAHDSDHDHCADQFESMAPKGFRVRRHEVTLIGQCPACTAPKPRRPGTTRATIQKGAHR